MINHQILRGEEFFRPEGLLLRHENADEIALSVKGGVQLVCANDLAILAHRIYQNQFYFHRNHDVHTRYTQDFDGSGRQRIDISKEERPRDYTSDWILRITFAQCYRDEESFIYEADLIEDTRTGYPYRSANRGLKKFKACHAFLNQPPIEAAEWITEQYILWRGELDRIENASKSLHSWASTGLDMAVRCRSCVASAFLGDKIQTSIFSSRDLNAYASSGLDLTAFASKLKCSACGKRRQFSCQHNALHVLL